MYSQHVSLPTGDWSFAGRAQFIILNDFYDPNQYWLDFTEAVMFRTFSNKPHQREVELTKMTIRSGSKKHWKVINQKLEARLLPGEDVHPYRPQVDIHQHVLPFLEWQFVSDHMANILRQTHFPAFDRDTEGRIYQCHYMGVRVAKATNKMKYESRAKEWLAEYCVGRVVLEKTVTFEKHDDAILALTSGLFQRIKEAPASKS